MKLNPSFEYFFVVVPTREIRVALAWYTEAAARAALPIPMSVCSSFRVFEQCYGFQYLKLLTCTQVLMHAIAPGGCTATVRESALEVDSGGKLPCHTWDSNPCQYCA